MNKVLKKWLIIAITLIVVGLISFCMVMYMFNWNFKKLSTLKYENNIYEINESFNSITIDADATDIVLAMSDDETIKVECYEPKKAKHSVTVENNTLIIKENQDNAWYDNIGISFDTPKITVYLLKTDYETLAINNSTGDIEIPKDFKFINADILLSTGHVNFYSTVIDLLKIKASTGSICVKNVTVGSLDLKLTTGTTTLTEINCENDVSINASTGKTYLSNVRCKNLTSGADTGDINLSEVNVTEKLYITGSTGDVDLERSDASEIFIETDTGDVEGSLLTDKIFIVNTDTGDIDVPKTTTGGKCEITTDTGDIEISIVNE